MPFQFYDLNQTHRAWGAIYPAYNGDVYAGTANSGLFIRPFGESTFVELKTSGDASYLGNIYGLTGTPGGDIYMSRNSLKYAKRTAGAGDFVTYEVNYDYNSMLGMNYSSASGLIYNCHFNGPGVSRFDPAHHAGHAHSEAVWYSGNKCFHSCVSKAGDLYIVSHTGNGPGASTAGYIWKQVGETGSVSALGAASFPDASGGAGRDLRTWSAIAAAKNGDVYACDVNHVYRQVYGTDEFYIFQAITFIDMQGAPDGSVYAVVGSGDVYKLDSPTSTVKHYAQIIG